FRTFPVGTVTVGQLRWPAEALPAVLDALGEAPDGVGSELRVEPGGVNLLLKMDGSRNLLPDLPPGGGDLRVCGYWEGQDVLGESGPPNFFRERSQYVFSPLPPEGLDTVQAWLRAWPGTSRGVSWKAFQLGGTVARVAPEATAYVHR